LKNRFYLVAVIVVIAIIALIFYVASQPATSRNKKESTIVTVTIHSGFGIDRIHIFNVNTNEKTNRTMMDLPFSFNCTKGDYIQISETVLAGYEWDGWWIEQSGTFTHHNSLLVQVNGDLDLIPHCIIVELPAPTVTVGTTPTPAPSPSPTPSPSTTG